MGPKKAGAKKGDKKADAKKADAKKTDSVTSPKKTAKKKSPKKGRRASEVGQAEGSFIGHADQSKLEVLQSEVSVDQSQVPVDKSQVAVDKSQGPVVQVPVDQSQGPVVQVPVEEVPVDKSQVPVDQITVDQSKVPVDVVQVEQSQVPVEQSQVQVEQSQVQVEQSQVPVDQSQVPVDQSQVPVDQSQVPTDQSQVPDDQSQAQVVEDNKPQCPFMRFIELEKEIQQLESQNPMKEYEMKKKAAKDVQESIGVVEVQLQQLVMQTKKEKADADMPSIRDRFKSDIDLYADLSQDEEEYLEAKNREEVARQNLKDLKKQLEELKSQAEQCKIPANKLRSLFEQRDALLSDIFDGEYGSDKENLLESQFDSLMQKKDRVSMAFKKWTNGRNLLHHAVNQLCSAVHKWDGLKNVPPMHREKLYDWATEVRNNLVAAMQNVNMTQKHLETINFPYCGPPEMETLDCAVTYIYTDMLTADRQKHAYQCYNVTYKRAAALLQWFDMVIKDTIHKDLVKASQEARKVEKELRTERIRMIRDKVAESGGDVKVLNDADQQQEPEDEELQRGEGTEEQDPDAPAPLPLSELAPMPTQDDLFGDISLIKEQFKKDTEEFNKAQELNKARAQQGLEEKLAARRHRKT